MPNVRIELTAFRLLFLTLMDRFWIMRRTLCLLS